MEKLLFESQRGVSLIGLSAILPLLFLLLWFIIGFGSFLNQAMWLEQTAYNSTLMSSELDSKLSIGEKEVAVAIVVNRLKAAHLEGGHKKFIGSTYSTVKPYDPSLSDNSDPGTFLTSVEVGGDLLNIFNSKLSVVRKVYGRSLLTSPPTNDDPEFSSSLKSGNAANVSCCGLYTGGGGGGSCVSAKKYASGCNPTDPGYWPP